MRKLSIYLISTILLISFVSAYSTYEYTGKANGLYNSDSTTLIQSDADFIGIRNLNNPKAIPLVADLDNDGINDIIVIDGENIRIYNEEDLDIIDVYDTNDGNISEVHIFDVDDNGLLDIIYFSCKEERVYFLEYNNSVFTSSFNYLGGVTDFGCRNEIGLGHHLECTSQYDYCMLMTIGTAGNWNPTFTAFNKTHESPASAVQGMQNMACMPYIKSFFYGDLSGVGTYQWVATSIEMDNLGDDHQNIEIHVVTVDHTNNFAIIQTTYEHDLGNDFDSDLCYEDFNMVAITSPLVFNFDGASSNGKEILIGSINEQVGTAVESKLYVFGSDGTLLTTYPTGNAEGYPTNIVRTNLFDTTSTQEACLMLHAETDSEQSSNPTVTFLCGSEQASEIIHHREFVYILSDVLTRPPTNYNGIMHGIEADFTQIEGTDPTELITTFGLFTPNLDRCNPITAYCELGFNDIITQFETGAVSISDIAVLPIELVVPLRSDFLILSESALYYFDDGFSKSDCGEQQCITDIHFNPDICNNNARVNTTLGILVRVQEVDSDIITCQAIAYVGEGLDELNMGQQNVSGGSGTIIFNTVLNKTSIFSELQVFCFETDDPTEVDIHTQIFSVTHDGDEFGDSSCNISVVDVTVADEEVIGLESGAIGVFCDTGSDCASGKCLYGKCSLKYYNEVCTYDSECMSGQCLDSKCTQPSLSQLSEQAKDDAVGTDQRSSDILSVLIILGSMITALVLSLIAGNVMLGIIIAILVAYVEAFLLTLMGWLSPFILIGFLFVGLIIIVLMIVLKGDR